MIPFMKIWSIQGTNLGFCTLQDAKNYQHYCNEHSDVYGFIDDDDIEETQIMIDDSLLS